MRVNGWIRCAAESKEVRGLLVDDADLDETLADNVCRIHAARGHDRRDLLSV
ncbi:hypothetical protein [Corynebacterium sp. SA-MJD20WY100]|uniref:hypothetical protein n=1 Tax=Corynebacterium sp. SA-MJD20WY100 TaxID=3142969 RepID=UPI003221C16C